MSFEIDRDKSVSLIDAFSKRVSWKVFKTSICQSDAVPKARNYDGLIQKLEKFEDNLANKSSIVAILSLKSSLVDHAISGEKAVRLYRSSLDNVSHLIASILYLEERFVSTDPFFDEDQRGLSIRLPVFSHIRKAGNEYSLTFITYREVAKKETIPITALLDEFKDSLSGGELYFVSTEIKKCYDVVSIHADSGMIELRVDNGIGFSVDARERACALLGEAFNSLCVDSMGKKLDMTNLDLFPAIQKMHELPVGDGRVVELHFVTDEGGVKVNKVRNKAEGCVLNEQFHMGGCARINNHLNVYRIARSWRYTNGAFSSEPELMLPGTLKMVSSFNASEPFLSEVVVTKCVGHQDYNMLIQKLLRLMPAEQVNV